MAAQGQQRVILAAIIELAIGYFLEAFGQRLDARLDVLGVTPPRRLGGAPLLQLDRAPWLAGLADRVEMACCCFALIGRTFGATFCLAHAAVLAAHGETTKPCGRHRAIGK